MTIWGVVVLVKIVVWRLLEVSGSLIFCTHKRWWPIEIHQLHSSQKFCEEALRPPLNSFFFFFLFFHERSRVLEVSWRVLGQEMAKLRFESRVL